MNRHWAAKSQWVSLPQPLFHSQTHTRTKCYKDLAILDSSLISHSHSKTSAHAYTHTPWTQDILALRCQLSCYLVFKVSDWATDSPLFYRSDFHTSPHWCQQDLVTFHSPSVTFFFFFVNHLEKTLCLVSQIRDLSQRARHTSFTTRGKLRDVLLLSPESYIIMAVIFSPVKPEMWNNCGKILDFWNWTI